MKKVLVTVSLFALSLTGSLFSSACGCHPPNCIREYVCDQYGNNCEWRTKRRFFVQNNFQAPTSELNQYAGIFDLATPWQLDTTGSPRVTIKLENNTGGFVEENFTLTFNQGISLATGSVDKNTTPTAFVISDKAAVSNFLSSASTSGYSNSEATVTFTIPVVLADNSIASGKYVNHLRVIDSTGITYDDTFYFIYTAPENGCSQGIVAIGE